MKHLNICIDIDGTITDEYYWLNLSNWYFNKKIEKEQVTQYEIHKVMGLKEEEYEDFYERYKYSMHEGQKIREGAREALEALSEDHNLIFVTARDKDLEVLTYKYLKKNGIPFDGLHVLGTHHKVETAKELECDLFIEDSYANAVELSTNGFKVLLIDTLYNRLPLNDTIVRVQNWNEIYEYVQEMLLQKKAV